MNAPRRTPSGKLILDANGDVLYRPEVQNCSDVFANGIALRDVRVTTKYFKCLIKVRNIAYEKIVLARLSFTKWINFQDVNADWLKTNPFQGTDSFEVIIAWPGTCRQVRITFCCRQNGIEMWDSGPAGCYVFHRPPSKVIPPRIKISSAAANSLSEDVLPIPAYEKTTLQLFRKNEKESSIGNTTDKSNEASVDSSYGNKTLKMAHPELMLHMAEPCGGLQNHELFNLSATKTQHATTQTMLCLTLMHDMETQTHTEYFDDLFIGLHDSANKSTS